MWLKKMSFISFRFYLIFVRFVFLIYVECVLVACLVHSECYKLVYVIVARLSTKC